MNNSFAGSFGNLVSPLNTFFGLNSTTTPTLSTGPFTNTFGSQFTGTNFNSGFLGGFGGTFPGFGLAPETGFNNNFGLGFNNMIGTGLTGFGFGQGSSGGLGTGGLGGGGGLV